MIGAALDRDLGPLHAQRGLQAGIVVDCRQRQRSQVALHGDCISSRQAASQFLSGDPDIQYYAAAVGARTRSVRH